jgi:hypothetical protein
MLTRRLKKFYSILLVFMITIVSPSTATIAFAANQTLTVDLSSSTGAIKYGASGFLYGLGDDGIPSDAVLSPLHPRVAAQMPQGGSQHPDGGAFDVAPQFFAAGGDNIEIYMQDIYSQWPYENLGVADYLTKVESIVNEVVANQYHSKYVYVPFNEPDQIWYSNNVSGLCDDWKTVYDKIRSIDSIAKIAGPNYASYNSSAYNQFMTFCKNNNCLPDIITWHELQDSFFTNWYSNVSNYRSIENNLGISARPICINEYGRFSGDLGYPGNMVQWIARFENSKVDACRAYWGAAGNLDELVTENNKANGDWWLYKWYGELTGNTVTVTPPSTNGSLQGLAALDSTKKQARVLFGGSQNSTDVFNTDVVVKGFESASYFTNSVHVIVMGVDATAKDANTGFAASSGPYIVQEGDYTISNGQITVAVNNMKALSAYQMIVTPNTDLTVENISGHYEAEYAELAGASNIATAETNYSGTGYVQGFGGTNSAATTYVTSVAEDGYYNVKLRYSAGSYPGVPSTRYLQMKINGNTLKNVMCSQISNWSTWADVTTTVFLQAGINLITYSAYTNDESDCVNQDYIEVTSGSGTVTSYEAEAAGNILGGTAVAQADTAASGGNNVGYIGLGLANTLKFNNISVPSSGVYKMVVRYANAEKVGEHSYNTNVVDRTADITVNGTVQKSGIHFRNTYLWNNYSTTVIDVILNAGNNTIMFSNSSAYAPNIDMISIAATESAGNTTGIISGATYKLINRNSEKALDVSNASTVNGGDVIQWTYNDVNNQKWQITDLGNGYYKLINVNSTKALDVSTSSTADGGDVIQWSYNGGNNQKWQIIDLGNGYYKLMNVNSGKALDIYNESTTNGGNVVQWSDNGGYNQQWQILAP